MCLPEKQTHSRVVRSGKTGSVRTQWWADTSPDYTELHAATRVTASDPRAPLSHWSRTKLPQGVYVEPVACLGAAVTVGTTARSLQRERSSGEERAEATLWLQAAAMRAGTPAGGRRKSARIRLLGQPDSPPLTKSGAEPDHPLLDCNKMSTWATKTPTWLEVKGANWAGRPGSRFEPQLAESCTLTSNLAASLAHLRSPWLSWRTGKAPSPNGLFYLL